MGQPGPGPFSFKTLGPLWPAMGIGPGPKVPTNTKVKVLQDQLDEVKALLRGLAQSTQVSSSATAPQVDDSPTDDPTTDDLPIGDM